MQILVRDVVGFIGGRLAERFVADGQDEVEANVTFLDEDAADGEAVNAGSTDTIGILTLAEEIRDQLVPDLELECVERHDAEHTHADTGKAQELLDYERTYTNRDGVKAFLEWSLANREWYEQPVMGS